MKQTLLVFFLLPLTAWTNPHRGQDALSRIDALPQVRRGVTACQISSFERNGGNNDFNFWLYQDAEGDYVIFDEIGAGCIYRIWMTHGGAHPGYQAVYGSTVIKIYLDEDTEPRFECTFDEFFSGSLDPFVFPLVGNKDVSSGGYYSYFPIPYERRCRITLSDIPPASMRYLPWGTDQYRMYYNITYHKYTSPEGIASWTGSEDCSEAVALLKASGSDPKPVDDNLWFERQLQLDAGTNCVVAQISGEGVVNSIEFDMPVITESEWTNLWLRIYWDDQPEAAVDVPFGLFFGSALGAEQVDGLLAGIDGQRCYAYFPMPFWQSARIELENRGAADVGVINFSVGVEGRECDAATEGLFHACHAENVYTNRVPGSDFIALEESGRGHYVGLSLHMTGAGKIYNNGLMFLEGDERITIDGSNTPQLHGTGNEDYFNGGWYYDNGVFALPYHGSPVRSNPYGMNTETNYIGAYRFHVGDLIPFNSSIKLGLEHGGENEVGCRMSSVAYYYKLNDGADGLTLCAEIDVGDSLSESLAQYSVSGTESPVTNEFCYTGDDHDILLSDDGVYPAGLSSFSVDLPVSNDGIQIRRRTETGAGRQRASVYVDGNYVTDWYLAEGANANELQRWTESELCIPFEYTAGKSNITIDIEISNAFSGWNEYAYTVYSLKPLSGDGDLDGDGIQDTWEAMHFDNLIACNPAKDDDIDGFDNREEYICLTDPFDEESFFKLDVESGVGEVFSFETHPLRVYRVMQSTNLSEGVWQEAESIPGDGHRSIIHLPALIDHPMFYKVSVGMD